MPDKTIITVSGPIHGTYVVQVNDHVITANCNQREQFRWRVNNNTSIAIQVFLDRFAIVGGGAEMPIDPNLPTTGTIEPGEHRPISARVRQCAHGRATTRYSYWINPTNEFGEPLVVSQFFIVFDQTGLKFVTGVDPELDIEAV
jgi:hypothetical protein